ncbi:hypothetical protein NHX12_025249 [Muraenolepis orangiensis]|uniref:GH3 domain-containing protein n=1 Tax=Muraenolepis orangiensis TaxID=630683 RepID=A0A9Q0IRE6_9TELE|nr:hypothetical protein NHX12_025249 [Muraenolepis orangiensis]
MGSLWDLVVLPLVFASLSIAVGVITHIYGLPPLLPTALGILSAAGAAFLWRDIRSKVTGKGRTAGSLVSHYLVTKVVGWLGRRQRGKLEADTCDVTRAQEETLLRRLRKNADTLYGKRYDFSSIKDISTFRERHPVTDYEHYRQLIGREAAGEDRVMLVQRPARALAGTSGTSGASGAVLLSTGDADSEFFMQRTTKFIYNPSLRQSEAGTPSIAPAFQVPSERDLLYLHLLFALRDPSVGTLESNFSSTLFYAFTTLQERWQELVEDVEVGKLSPSLGLGPRLRAALEGLLEPDPGRAAELEAHFQQGFRGIARRLWPRLNLVLAVDSGSDRIYGETLRDHYCQGVDLYSPVYAATEGLIGVNLWPQVSPRRYLLCPRSMFCEFLPEACPEAELPRPLLIGEVEEGRSYELVVTNASGLYRYRLGDVVKVVGFHNQCPIVEFQYRRSQMLNLRGEKVSEVLFLEALKQALVLWPGAQLVDYCCAESDILGDSVGGGDPHYQVFVELKGLRNLTEVQRYKLDQCLQQASAVYKSFRVKGSLGPMRVQLVSGGAFAQLRKHMTDSSGAAPHTFRMPRVLRRKDHAHFLVGKTVS